MSIGSIPPALALLLTVALVAGLRRIAPWVGLVDVPTVRKAHEGLVPVCGGIAMFVALLVAMVFRHGLEPHGYAKLAVLEPWSGSGPFVPALGMLVVIGVADDRWEMDAGVKLLLQGIVACVMTGLADGAHLHDSILPMPSLMPAGNWIAIWVTLAFIVGLINAFNMIDGLDGLAGGLAVVALSGLAIAGTLVGHDGLVDESLLLVAVVLGFLTFNLRRPGLPRALAFMGDAGSMMLGCAVAGLIVALSSRAAAGERGMEIFSALLWLVAIPVIDTISLMIRRPLAGRSPMTADRAHLHYLLLEFGLSPMLTTAVLIGIAALLATVGILGIIAQAPASLMLFGLAVPAIGHSAYVWACARRRKTLVQTQALLVSSEPAE